MWIIGFLQVPHNRLYTILYKTNQLVLSSTFISILYFDCDRFCLKVEIQTLWFYRNRDNNIFPFLGIKIHQLNLNYLLRHIFRLWKGNALLDQPFSKNLFLMESIIYSSSHRKKY